MIQIKVIVYTTQAVAQSCSVNRCFKEFFLKFIRKKLCCSLFFIKLQAFTFGLLLFFFLSGFFFDEHSRIIGLQGKGEGISLTPHYHFHPPHRHLDISRAITAESSPPHIGSTGTRQNREPLVSKCKSLTTKLHTRKCV